MHTDDESEIEYTVVKRVASVTIESDSQVEAEVEQRCGRKRRKKRIVKRKSTNERMDIDINVSQPKTVSKGMDWDGLCSTSELSSSETCSSDGREADDEQSDWVGPVNEDQNFFFLQTSARQQRFIKTRTASAALQRKLERFIRDDSQRELVVKHWTRYRQVCSAAIFPSALFGVNSGYFRLFDEGSPDLADAICQAKEFGVPLGGAFTEHDFEVLVNEAVRLILGQTAPNYTLGPFDEFERKGSVVVQACDVNLIWAALSIYGRFFGKPIALHFNSVGYILVCTLLDHSGSKGIGKAIAISLIKRGCSVSLAARNVEQLELACIELNALAKTKQNGAVAKYYSVDVTSSYATLEAVISKAENELGGIDILVNNAGYALQGAFDAIDVSEFEEQMRLNFLSAVYMTRAVVSKMKKSRSGQIIFVNSAAGQCPIWGYTAYGATKFALRGFAEALHMELLPYNVQVSVIYPPNTNTEGYQLLFFRFQKLTYRNKFSLEREILTMPKELEEISSTAGLFEPKVVAECFIHNLSCGNYHTCIGLEGWALGVLTAGGAPEKNFMNAVAQVLLGGLLRAVMLIYIAHFNWIVKKHSLKR
uniref:3-dehydrosphinganine reductase n=1 Tax=Setaria digitata TaxID=48799 RepID=A0A915Q6T5_9BILA